MSYQYLAEKMVKEQLVAGGIQDERILQAFLAVPRHLFVEDALQERSYAPHPLPIGNGQTISQPYIQAISIQLMELREGTRVLEVGTGSGYQTALLAEIMGDVWSVEQYTDLLRIARERLDQLRYSKVRLRAGDGSRGWEQFAPYHGIVVAAAGPTIPAPLYEQLAEGGHLVLPVDDGGSQRLVRVTKTADGPHVEDHGECRFVPLVGKHGFASEDKS